MQYLLRIRSNLLVKLSNDVSIAGCAAYAKYEGRKNGTECHATLGENGTAKLSWPFDVEYNL